MTATFLRRDTSETMSGILLAASSFAFSSGGDVIYKLLAAGHPSYQIMAVNSLFALIPVFLCVWWFGGARIIHTARPARHIMRAMLGLSSTLCGVFAFRYLPLTEVYAIIFAGPLLVTALSSRFLGEKVDRAGWLAIGGGFAGVLIVIAPAAMTTAQASQNFWLGRAAALLCVLFYALSVLMVRSMKSHETSLTFSVFGYGVAMTAGLVLWLLFGAPPLTAQELHMLVLAGLINSIGSLCLTEAYCRTPIALVAPFQYTQIVWGALAGFILWHNIPPPSLVAGAAVVMACGLFLLRKGTATKVTRPSVSLSR